MGFLWACIGFPMYFGVPLRVLILTTLLIKKKEKIS
jgi:hypothetical protein